MSHPPRKAENVFVQELDDEVLIHTPESGSVHVISGPLRQVFELCDGTRDLDSITNSWDGDEENPTEVVGGALQVLEELKILEWSAPRRKFLQAASLAALVCSVQAPASALAGSAQCNSCADVTTAGGVSPLACCAINNPTTPCAGCGATGGTAICGAVACFEPVACRCSCRANNGFCDGTLGGTIVALCCMGTNPSAAQCG